MPARIETFAELARRVLDGPPRLGHTRLVAVDGPSGAGKSRFAGHLAAAVNANVGLGGDGVPVLSTDDLLDGWDDQLTFWPRLERWVLAAVRDHRPGRYRRYDWARRRFEPRWRDVPAGPVLIVEGVSAARSTIRDECTLTVFVTAPPQLRVRRALARDGREILPHLVRWRRAERTHFAVEHTIERVDLVVDGATEPDGGDRYLRLR